MEQRRFYALRIKETDRHGVLYAPENVDFYFGHPGKPANNYQNIVFELRDGDYGPLMVSNRYVYFINEELKQLLGQVVNKSTPIEFLPMKIKSYDFGDRIYYMAHFTDIMDTINVTASKKVPETDSITIPYVDSDKVKGLDLFNTPAYPRDMVISNRVKQMIKKIHLDNEIRFWELGTV